MKIYFLSSTPCALTLNGVFFGVTDKFQRFAEIHLADRIFAQFSPEGALPIGFFITESLPFSPPDGCEVYLLKDGVAVYAKEFPALDTALRPIAQKRDGDLLVTVYAQGRVQVSIESKNGFFNAYLPPSFSICEITFPEGLILLQGQNVFALFNKKGERLLQEDALSVAVEESVLSATLPLSDALGRTAECKWLLSKDGCTRTACTFRQERRENDDIFLQAFIAYAFFESVLIGADYREFLASELLPEAEQIVAFLGDFIAVTPTDEPTVCGLVKKKAERLFEVEYYSIELREGKIIDVKG